MAIIKPVTDADKVYGDGDWRPILGPGPRKNDWKLHIIGKSSIEDRLRGVIIPSYDYRLDTEDKAFPLSVGACWTADVDQRNERHFEPNAWGVPIMMYPFLGERKEHWVSPANRRNMIGNDRLDAEDYADAFDDLNKWIRRNKGFSDAQKDFYLKTKKLSDDPLVPGRTVRYFSLSECKDKENPWHLAAVCYTSSAHSYMVEQMRWRHEDGGAPRDPDWPRYLIGDPTNPDNALVWHADKVNLDPKDGYDTNVICFTQKREFRDDDEETRKISDDVLSKRFLLVDPANWNIPTYEEQVNHMIEHYAPEVTADMIRAACGHRCRVEIPDRPKNRVVSTGASPEAGGRSRTSRDDADATATRDSSTRRRSESATATRDEEEEAPARSMAPSQSSRPPMPDASSKVERPKVDVSKEHFAGKAGQKPAKMSVGTMQAMVDAGDYEGLKVHLNGAWVKVEDSGLVTMPPVMDDIPDDVPGDIPGDDDAPPPFEEDAPDAEVPTEGGITKDEMRKRIFPDDEQFEAFDASMRKRALALIDKAYEATDKGKKQELPPELIDEMLELVG